jgi:hypothetical protein
MRSGDPIEVPPYLWTMSAIVGARKVDQRASDAIIGPQKNPRF